jgi:putative transposase
MPNYRRVWVPGGTYFFTVNLLERKRTLLTDHIDSLRDAFRKTRMARPFTMSAYVILPDHLHCIWTLPSGDDDIATRWRQIKTLFSRSLPKVDRVSAERRRRSECGILRAEPAKRIPSQCPAKDCAASSCTHCGIAHSASALRWLHICAC